MPHLAGLVALVASLHPAAPSGAVPPATTMRVAAYNVEWFSEDANPERIANLKSVMTNLHPDVIGLEEVQSRRALAQVFGDEWTIGIADEASEDQEVAIAVRKPYRLVSSELVFPDKGLDYAFPGRRDVLRSVVASPDGTLLTLYGVHMKSRSGGRRQTDGQRRMGAALLAAYISGRRDERTLVLGDFNDSPEDESLAILETGDLLAKPRAGENGPLLTNPFAALYRRDYVSFGLHGTEFAASGRPIVAGARSENERTRGIDYRYPQDLKVTQTLMDMILVSPALKGTPGIYAGADALRGTPGRTRRGAAGTEYAVKGSLASDHLPVYLDLTLPASGR